MLRFVKLNKAKCLHCGDIVISNPETPSLEEKCQCNKLIISGGSTHMIRNGKQGVDYQEMSQLSFDDCPNIKEDTQDPPPHQNAFLKSLEDHVKKRSK